MVTDNFDKACKSLYCVIKDHNWPYAVSLSQVNSFMLYHIVHCDLNWGPMEKLGKMLLDNASSIIEEIASNDHQNTM